MIIKQTRVKVGGAQKLVAHITNIALGHVVISGLIKDLTDMVSKLCDKIDRLEERRGSQT